ncbi:hypothetical protein FCIRC_2206 [Fusarium circinatum]|uniref:Uncharacterized protein n=1 Tax=Fusarium circinatum TaxID=48490 RepID=A0A8H5X8U4_FUSCI|nr:hypothetical protein FCIRC_2206 [Fusarium circinatum]
MYAIAAGLHNASLVAFLNHAHEARVCGSSQDNTRKILLAFSLTAFSLPLQQPARFGKHLVYRSAARTIPTPSVVFKKYRSNKLNMARNGTQQQRLESRILKKKQNQENEESNIAWLNETWNGPDWIPADVRAASKKAKVPRSIVRFLKAISELAIKRNVPLSSLWEPGGCIRSVVDSAVSSKNGPKSRNKPPKPGPLTKNQVLQAYNSLESSGIEKRDATSSLSGPKTGDNHSGKAAGNEVISSPSSFTPFGSSAMQRYPFPCHDTVASPQDELREPQRGTKRLVEDNEDETLNPPLSESKRVALEKALGTLSPYQIQIVHRKMTDELDTALAAKHGAEKALLDLLHGKSSMPVSQAERVQARRRKLEAEEAFNQAYGRLHRPSQLVLAMGDIKETFDARAICALELERAQKEAYAAKSRLEQAQANHEAALKSNF